MRMAEKQSEHRQNLEKESLDIQRMHIEQMNIEAKRGQWFAFIVFIFWMVVTLVLADMQMSTGAVITACGAVMTIAPIVINFIHGRFGKSIGNEKQENDLEKEV